LVPWSWQINTHRFTLKGRQPGTMPVGAASQSLGTLQV